MNDINLHIGNDPNKCPVSYIELSYDRCAKEIREINRILTVIKRDDIINNLLNEKN